MGEEISLFKGSTGLNNKVDPVRLVFNLETGVTELSLAVNVKVDPSGRVDRQPGYEQLVTGAWHSLCPYDMGGYTYAVKGASLYSVDLGGNILGIRSGLTENARMDYERSTDGRNTLVYYVNGHEKGYLIDRTSYAWEDIDYVGPDTEQVFDDPVSGAHLATIFNGRMYLAQHNYMIHSEHQDYSAFNLAEDHTPFNGRISMIKGMKHGMYVSDAFGVYFLSGSDIAPGDWETLAFEEVATRRAVEGCNAKMDAQYLNPERKGKALLWYSRDGIFAGYDDGTTVNLTHDKLSHRVPATGTNYLPDGTFGAMTVINNEYLLITIEP
mgnify:CR=1 FL=1